MRPIANEEWGELLRPLPADADRHAVRQALEAAIDEYVHGADRDQQYRDIWRQIGCDAGSRIVPRFYKYCETILRLENFQLDPQTKALLNHVLLLRQALGNTPLPRREEAEARAAVYLATERRSRFRSRVSLAWTGPGKGRLSISEAGPFVRFLVAICERVEDPLDGAGVKKFVRRERARRAVLNSIKEVWGIGGDVPIMQVDEGKIYLLDASGQRKP